MRLRGGIDGSPLGLEGRAYGRGRGVPGETNPIRGLVVADSIRWKSALTSTGVQETFATPRGTPREGVAKSSICLVALSSGMTTWRLPLIPPWSSSRFDGEIGGVKVRGWIDLLDVEGRVIDIKTAKPGLSIEPMHKFQVATYSHLIAGPSGKAALIRW